MAQDLYFTEVDYMQYPGQIQYQVIDFDDDGLDELFCVRSYEIVIYSFDSDNQLLSLIPDTSIHTFKGARVVQYDSDPTLEILLVGILGKNLYLVDDYDAGQFEWLTELGMWHGWWDSPANILCMGAGLDGIDDIVITWLGFYDGGPCGHLGWAYDYGGDAVSLNSADWTENWAKYNDHWGWFPPAHPSGEHAGIMYSPLDGKERIVTWGQWIDQYCIHEDTWEKLSDIKHQFRVYSDDGTTLFS